MKHRHECRGDVSPSRRIQHLLGRRHLLLSEISTFPQDLDGPTARVELHREGHQSEEDSEREKEDSEFNKHSGLEDEPDEEKEISGTATYPGTRANAAYDNVWISWDEFSLEDKIHIDNPFWLIGKLHQKFTDEWEDLMSVKMDE